MHPHESLIRTHVEGEGSERERQEVDEHLKDCTDCQDFLSFVQDFSEAAKELANDEIAADEPHAPNSVIIAYEEGKMDAETSLHLRAHMLYCDQCAEAYYLLKRMRAPSWTEVVIGIIHRAKETLLEALEITGMGELVPVTEAVSRGSGDEVEEGKSKIQIMQHVADSEGEADVILSVEPNNDQPGNTIRISIGVDPPKPAWRAKLLDLNEKRIVSVPLNETKQLLHSGFASATFIAQVVRDEEILSECRVKIRVSHE